MFISFEGPDGSGKTTQARMLYEKLRENGQRVLLVREPGGTPIGEKVRELLLDPRYKEMTVISEILLFCTARNQLVTEHIRPALNRGEIVISDRYWDSLLVYQGIAGGENLEIIKQINLWATGNLIPHRTFLIDLEVEKALMRARKLSKGDRIEQKELDFFDRVRSGFLELASQEPWRFCIIPADRDAESIHQDISRYLEECLDTNNKKPRKAQGRRVTEI